MKKIQLFTLFILSVFGNIYVSKAQVNIIETISGTSGSTTPIGDGGQASAAKFSGQYMMTMDAAGNIYIADNGDARVRMISAATGIINTVAGSSTSGFSGDGAAATAAQLGAGGGPNPGVVGVAVDAAGHHLYISDGTNNRLRMVDMTTGIITTICGNGTAGFQGDGGPATAATCEISGPRGLAVDAAGNIYFSDAGNQRIRMITASTGIISTIAGTGSAGYTTDGVAAIIAKINNVRGVAVDALGTNVYLADQSNNRIRVVNMASGFIFTLVGNGTGGFAGDGGPATAATVELRGPTDMKFDAAGNMYIADVTNARVRMVNSAGIISTVAGNGSGGFSSAGDGGPATAAAVRISQPVSVLPDNTGRTFYISDRGFDVIRQVRPNSTPYFAGGSRQSLTICENATATSINSLLAIVDTDKFQTETWSAGAWTPINGTAVVAGSAASTGAGVTPAGMTYTPTPGYSGMDSFIVQVSDGYNTASDTIIVTINGLPAVAAIGGPSTVCQGSSITLTESTGGGTWSESTGNTSVTGGTVDGLVAGTDVITYGVTNACGTTNVTANITVNPLPFAGTITGSTNVCTGGTTVLMDAVAGGSWSASNGNASVTGGTVTGNVAGTTDVISYTYANGCGSDVTSVTVNVITVPGVGTTLTGSTTMCVGGSVVLTSTVSGGTWSESTGNTSVAGGTVDGLVAGTDIITYALSNSCGTNNITQSVTVNPLPNAGAITGLSSVCLGGTINLMDAQPGGSWTASNAHATVTGTGVVTGVTVGTDVISYTVINGCGTAVATTTINIVTVPSAGTITGASTVCEGANTVLTDAVTGGAWTALNGNATVAGGTVTGVTAGTDIITYTVNFSCGTATTTKAITINPLPAPAAISGSGTVCVGGTTLLTDATSGGTWTSSNTNASVSGTGLVSGAVAGQDTIGYALTNGCGTVTVTVNMAVNAVVTPGVSFSASPGFATCPGTSVTYTANPANGGALPVYQWKVNGTVLGSGSAFIYTPSNADVILCKMTTSLVCVSAPSVTFSDTVVVHPSLVPAAHIAAGITGDTLCVGDVATFTATPVNGGTAPTYQWNVNGLIYAFSNPFVYTPANGDVITCDMTSNYVCPLPATVTSNSVTMTVNTTEVPTIDITVSPGSSICAGQTATFTVHSLYGGTAPFYRWTRNGVNVATGPAYLYVPSNGDVVYAMMASSATCRTADSVFSNHITMNTATPSVLSVSISSSGGSTLSINQPDTLTAVVTGVFTPTYQWFANGAAIAGATTRQYEVSSALAGTEIITCVAGSGDACAVTAISNNLALTITDVAVAQIFDPANVLQLMPNPSRGVLSMNLASDIAEPVVVTVTNVVGEQVLELITTTNKATEIRIDRGTGIYVLTAATAHGKSVAKVIVE